MTQLLGRVPSGTKLTVLGITGNSFQEPDILLSADVPEDPGYFGERLAAGHRELVLAWRRRIARLTPNAKRTDILGALLVASQVFMSTPNVTKKILVIYSDMRQATPELNLDQIETIQIARAIERCRDKAVIADLNGVHVYVLGADAAHQHVEEWGTLRQFWALYFRAASADADGYSLLRDSSHIR